MPENNVEHVDCLGRKLKIGDCIAVAHSNQLMIATVKKINPKMIRVSPVGKRSNGYNKYSKECVLLEGPDITMFLLKMNTN